MQPLVGFLFIVFGGFSAAFPYAAWYSSVGWKFRDAEPSDTALAVNRAGGVVAVIIGLIIMVSSCSSVGDDSNYREYFQKRLDDAGYVQAIHVGFADAAQTLPKEEMDRAVDLMAHSKMTAFDPGNAYGAAGEATIAYSDGTTDELLLFGPSGGIELHPPGEGKAYKFESTELESLFRKWLH